MSNENLAIIKNVDDLRSTIATWRADGLTIGLVPTMGALHAGHLSLVQKLLKQCDRVVATIFINPKQFGKGEDLDRYPKTQKQDCEKLAQNGASAVFIPDASSIYPEGFSTNISVAGVSEGLCGSARPGHFDGVATIVAKLLIQAAPDVAIFGEKDFQQLAVIKQLCKDLDISTKITSGEIIRENDGLALSSRNAYLSATERAIAPKLAQVLQNAVAEATSGSNLREVEANAKQALLKAGFSAVDYVSFCHKTTLKEVDDINQPTQVLAAVHLGGTRLIDNFAVN